MSFLAMQTAIAKICVDHAFRKSFLRDPDEALASCDLTRDESEAVKAIDLKALEAYADTLVGKKMALVTKWFPLSMSALKKGLSERQFRRVVFSYGYQAIRDTGELGGEWVRGEFMRFKDYLLKLVSRGEIDIPFFSDVLEFEAARQMMSQDPGASRSPQAPASEQAIIELLGDAAQKGVKPQLGKHVSVRRFDCDIVALIAATERNDESETPLAADPTWAMFVKKPGTSKVVVQRISPAVRDVLELCDGTRTTGEILASIVTRHATPAGPSDQEVKGDCLTVLEQFYRTGLISDETVCTAS
jgi:hypothetical protein